MTDTLLIGDRAYSSWSLRGWLVFDAFGIPVAVRQARLYDPDLAAKLSDFAPARTVPALRCADGTVVWDSLAIAEELASRHPQAGLWPEDPALRGVARSLAAEMHAGFQDLRAGCPMNLRVCYSGFPVDDAIRADLSRIEALWDHALGVSGGPWLCGAYSVADVVFAPVAGRIAGYGLEVGASAAAYVARHLEHPSFRRWRAMGLVDGADQAFYRRPFARRPWPGPAPVPARAVEAGPAENAACPYSGDPPSHFLEMGGRVFGFCNAFCRDKTVADPEAWPAFMSVYHS
jgi:glutathione S-transferase